MHVVNVTDHPDLVDVIGRWHWDEWGAKVPGRSLESWTSSMRGEMGRDSVPATFVALDGDIPVGSVCLVEHDMPDSPDLAHLTPWVAYTFVVPTRRGQGVGRMLMAHAEAAAAAMGFTRVYLYATTARVFYEQLGWDPLADDHYEGESVTIMALDLETPRR